MDLLEQIESAVLRTIKKKSVAELLEFVGAEEEHKDSEGVVTHSQNTRRKADVDNVKEDIKAILGEHSEGVSIAQLRDLTGFDSPDIRHAIREMRENKEIRIEGEKRAARYFQPTKKQQLEIPTATPPAVIRRKKGGDV